MKRIVIISLLVPFALANCRNAEKPIDTVKIAKQYYKALDNSNSHELKML